MSDGILSQSIKKYALPQTAHDLETINKMSALRTHGHSRINLKYAGRTKYGSSTPGLPKP